MLRIALTKYPQPSANEVMNYMTKNGCGLVEARRKLHTPDTKVLQMLTAEGWKDVPTVVMLYKDCLTEAPDDTTTTS